MRKCPRCGNVYPEPFSFCPVDGGELPGADKGAAGADSPGESTIRTRTLARALAVLVLLGLLSFGTFFLYFYLKPKYGGLVV
jgi:hypothetical protein